MAVGAISASEVRPNVYNTSFGGKKKGGSANLSVQKDTADLAKVPVMVMIAMSPAMLNANEPVKALPIDAEQLTEIIAAPRQEKVVSTINFHQAPSRLKEFLGDDRVLYKKSFVSDGKKYTMYYSNGTLFNPANRENFVTDVIFVPSDYILPEDDKPPWLTKLIIHDFGSDRGFVGANIRYTKEVPDEYYGTQSAYYEKEIRLPNDIMNELMDFLLEETKFKPSPGLLKLPVERTSSPNLIKEHEL